MGLVGKGRRGGLTQPWQRVKEGCQWERLAGVEGKGCPVEEGLSEMARVWKESVDA